MPPISEQLTEAVALYPGDCLGVPENSIDAAVTDPPYHLTSIVKRFGAQNAAPAQFGTDGAYARASRGFMQTTWDGGDIAFRVETWAAVYKTLKPGAYIVAFSSSRTYHRMACAIEDAGFITHPLIAWIIGQGFPKAHNVSKHIDRMAGAEREVVGIARGGVKPNGGFGADGTDGLDEDEKWRPVTAPATDLAREWDGWYYGTQSLKPAIEPIYVGQKPFEKGLNGTQNVLKWGTGALNIESCRVGTSKDVPASASKTPNNIYGAGMTSLSGGTDNSGFNPNIGRWPANVIHDGSDEVVEAFPNGLKSGNLRGETVNADNQIYGKAGATLNRQLMVRDGDSGSAARFFYTAKADAMDRLGSKHPTVKPLDLMQYLVRLVCPPKGLCLDPFAGTGTTGEACIRESMHAILIEREAKYQNDIRRRMKLAMSGPDERAREAIKARMKDKPIDAGPLFGGDLP